MSLFHVSPVTPGFLMRPSGAAVQQPGAGVLLPQTLDAFTDPVLGDLTCFAQCALIPGSDAPLTLPVYTMPSGLAYIPGQSSVQTVLASAASSRPEGWSSNTPRATDIFREGPFDAYTSPMDTEDSPLVTTGLPGCPYQITSYTGPDVADTNPAFGLQLHHPRFLEFIGAPESARLLYHSPSFWVDQLGEEDAMAAAVNLQRDAGIMLSNLQILLQLIVCYVAASNVFRDDSTRDGTCGVPFEGDRGFLYGSEGAPGGQVHGCNGSVAPTDWSGRSRAGVRKVDQN